MKKIHSALISVFDKNGLEPIIRQLNKDGVKLYSTGGTQSFIEKLGVEVTPVENLTTYPSILSGRVKTLHPAIFGGILGIRDDKTHRSEMEKHNIPEIDVVIVDLYPFEKTVASGASDQDIIEKIDIGGISLIRAAAKNFNDVLIVPSVEDYSKFLALIQEKNSASNIEDRKHFAMRAFAVSSAYDSAIFNYFAKNEQTEDLRITQNEKTILRYGENPHQKAAFYGKLNDSFEQLHGKELSYNNLLDLAAATELIAEFKNAEPTFAIIKHNNACGVAIRKDITDAYQTALACDPVSAFGGVLIANRAIDKSCAEKINTLFCELVIAPAFENDALEILKSKKNRILLVQKHDTLASAQFRSMFGGVLLQERNTVQDSLENLKSVVSTKASESQIEDLLFASKICKHSKSNAIVLAKNKQLLASGIGQTSRIDSLRQAIEKANSFSFDLEGSSLASDAFFPFADGVEMAHKAGVSAILQPGGSINDKLSIDYAENNGLAMYFTGTRHFKH